MSDQVNTARVNVPMPARLREQVDLLASKDDVSAAAIVRRALKKYVEATCGKASK